MKTKLIALAIAATSISSFAADLEITGQMKQFKPQITSCLKTTHCSKNLELLMKTEQFLYKSLETVLVLNSKLPNFKYDYSSYFETMKTIIASLPEETRKVLENDYMNAVDKETDEVFKRVL